MGAASGVYLSWENLVSFQLGRKEMALLRHRVIQDTKNLISCFPSPWSSVSSESKSKFGLESDLSLCRA